MKIDTHQHFWKYNEKNCAWMDERMDVLKHDFLPRHLKKEIQAAGIDGVISVQARQSIQETEWLLKLADQESFIKGVTGWIPLHSPELRKELERLRSQEKLKAVRHVLQDEPDEAYMLRKDFNRGIRQLKEFGLVYEILIFERHLPNTIEFVDRHPDQVFVVDHIAKPRIREKLLSPWSQNIRELAKRENVSCKLSGMVTEADWENWKPSDLSPYLDVVLQAFGTDRLMVGSDWPVCLLAGTYKHVLEVVSDFIGKLSSDEQELIWAKNSQRVYKLNG